MCIRKKGRGYDSAEAVAGAIVKTGWSTKLFFERAKKFSRTNGFDVATAAANFEEAKGDPPQVVTTFADWVLVHELRAINERFR